MARFAEAYQTDHLDPLARIIAAAASHHRIAWVHPYLDGNGRVTRLSIETVCRLHGAHFIPETDIFDSEKNIKEKRLQWRVTIKSGRFTEKVGIIPDAAFAIERQDKSGIQRRWYEQ